MIAAGRNIGKRSWYIAKPTAEELYNLNTKILVFCNNPNMVTTWNRWESKLKISILKKVFLSVLCFCFVLFCFSMLWLLFVSFLGDVGVFLASYTRPHAPRLSLFFCLNLWVGQIFNCWPVSLFCFFSCLSSWKKNWRSRLQSWKRLTLQPSKTEFTYYWINYWTATFFHP